MQKELNVFIFVLGMALLCKQSIFIDKVTNQRMPNEGGN